MTDEQKKQQYIQKKWSDLKQFGYENLTREEVASQLEKALNGDKDLTVIGLFIKADLDEARNQ